MDNLKREILQSIRRSRPSPQAGAETASPLCRHRSKSSRSVTPSRSAPSRAPVASLTADDFDELKNDIIASLSNEIRQVALELAGVVTPPNPPGDRHGVTALAPPTESELYQTRLYTEL